MPMLPHLAAFYSVPLVSLFFKKMYISDSLYLQSTRYAGLILKLSTGTVMRNVILLKSHSLSKAENFLLFLFSLRVFYFLAGCVLPFRRLERGAVPGEGSWNIASLVHCMPGHRIDFCTVKFWWLPQRGQFLQMNRCSLTSEELCGSKKVFIYRHQKVCLKV